MLGVKSIWGFLFLVFSVKSQNMHDLLFHCSFRKSLCGLTHGNDGESWTRTTEGRPNLECVSSDRRESKCKELRSPSIAQLKDGPTCLKFYYINYVETANMKVSMFNSNSSYPVTSILLIQNDNERGIAGSDYILLPKSSYTQFSIGLKLSDPGDNQLKFEFYNIFVYPCPGATKVTAAATTPHIRTSKLDKTDKTMTTKTQTATSESEATTPTSKTTTPEIAKPEPETATSELEARTPTPETTTPEIAKPEPETVSPISCDLITEGLCFIYFNLSMSHQKAQKTCMSLQAKLAELRTKSIKNLLMSQVKYKKLKMWIGANDLNEEGRFVWESDNEKLNVLKSWWKRGEPNNWGGSEDCVMMKPPKGKLNDGNCDMKLTFFCQF